MNLASSVNFSLNLKTEKKGRKKRRFLHPASSVLPGQGLSHRVEATS